MSADDVDYDDLLEILNCLDDDADNSTQYSDEFVSDQLCIIKKRRSRRRSEIPQTFKNDIRLSYPFMYETALNSLDCSMMTSFLDRFFVPGFKSTYHFLQPIDASNPQSVETIGFASFLNMWYIGSLSAPDIVYTMKNSQIRTRADCSSVVGTFTVRASKVYLTPPPLEIKDEMDLAIAVGKKRKLRLKPKSKSKLTSTAIVLRQEQQDVEEYEDEHNIKLQSRFIDDIETTTISAFLPRPYTLTLNGTLTMHLDRNKRVYSMDYLATPSVSKLDLSEIL